MLGQFDSRLSLGIEKFEEGFFFRMVGLGRVAGSGSDTAVFFRNQVVEGDSLVVFEAPFATGSLVQHFGERFGQSIGQRLHEDRVVVVVGGFVLGRQRLAADAGRDRETADPIFPPALGRSDKIGQ